MVRSSGNSSIYHFGSFEFDPQTGELRKQGLRIRLEGQPVAILNALLEKPGQLVTREELQRKLWRNDTYVDFEQSLNAAVRRLRVALDDSAESPRFIETLARKGYRWVAPVSSTSLPPAEVAGRTPSAKTPTQWKLRTISLTVFLTISAILLIAAWRHSRSESHRIVLVVLPFQNFSEDPHQEFVADGMTEELITQLGGVAPQQLAVIARTSAMRYKGASEGAEQIARELKVNYLVEGSLRRQGSRIRVTAQLIQASDQTPRWAHSYDRDVTDVLKLQSEVASAIANEIRLQITPKTQQRLASAQRVSVEAHEAYLRGQQGWNLRSKEGLQIAIEQFEGAVQAEPGYAAAYAGLARAYTIAPVYGVLKESVAMPRAREAAARAIALDESVAEAHTAMGFVKAHYEYDWISAEREFRYAVQLNPSDPYAHLFYSNSCLSPQGRHDEAIAEMKKAIAQDPFSSRVQSFLGRTYIWARRYDDALSQLQQVIRTSPSFSIDHERLAHLYAYRGEFDKAIAEETEARILSGMEPRVAVGLEVSTRKAVRSRGAHGYWQKSLEFAGRTDNPPEAYTTTDGLAIVYALLGENDKALQILEKAYEQRQIHMTELAVEPAFDTLRSNPRFLDLLRRVGLH